MLWRRRGRPKYHNGENVTLSRISLQQKKYRYFFVAKEFPV